MQVDAGDALHPSWFQYLKSPACLSELSEDQGKVPRQAEVGRQQREELKAGHSGACPRERL